MGILANYPPFSQPADSPGPDNHGGLEGFEVDLMDALCAGARLNCTAVPMRSFDERIVALTSTTVDVLLAGLSYSEERAQRVRFVRPFYYSAGVELYSDSKEGQALAEALKGGSSGGAACRRWVAGWAACRRCAGPCASPSRICPCTGLPLQR